MPHLADRRAGTHDLSVIAVFSGKLHKGVNALCDTFLLSIKVSMRTRGIAEFHPVVQTRSHPMQRIRIASDPLAEEAVRGQRAHVYDMVGA